jgi:hypothetical protein
MRQIQEILSEKVKKLIFLGLEQKQDLLISFLENTYLILIPHILLKHHHLETHLQIRG